MNEKCIRFSNSLLSEIAYFPGIDSTELYTIDRKQVVANFHQFISPDIHVVAKSEDNYLYFRNKNKDIDIRYLKENSELLCEIDLNHYNASVFVKDGDHVLKERLGKYFSVYQDNYNIVNFYKDISKSFLVSIP